MHTPGRSATIDDRPLLEPLPRLNPRAATTPGPVHERTRLLAGAWWFPWLLLGLGLALWLISLSAVRVGEMSDLGLVSVLPPTALIALVLVAVSAGLAITATPFRQMPVAASLAIVLFMVYGVTAIVEPAPRFAITYVHTGFVEAISRRLELFPNLDARFDWPVFFILVAFVKEVAGLADPLALTPWVPLLSNVLYLGPLAVVLRSITGDRRLIWLSLWIFVASNWIGQDYFSPQGFNVLIYVAFLALLLRYFRPPAGVGRWFAAVHARLRLRDDRVDAFGAPRDPAPTSDRPRLEAVVAVLILLFGVTVSSHQLTPFVLLGGTTALVVLRRSTLTRLPLVMALMLGAWLAVMASTYLAGHLSAILRDLGQAGAVASTSVAERITGSPGHVVVVYVRLAATLAIWLLAAVGVLRRARAGRFDLAIVALAGVPFGAIVLQSYGGEILLRVYLFALPFMAFLAAAAFRPRRGPWSTRARRLLVGTLVVMLLVVPITRYGNERADSFTADEVAAGERLYEVAEPGSLLVTANYNAPYLHRGYEQYEYATVGSEARRASARLVVDALVDTDAPASYLFLTRSQFATEQLFYGLPDEAWARLVEDLRAAPELVLVHESRDALIFRLDRGTAR